MRRCFFIFILLVPYYVWAQKGVNNAPSKYDAQLKLADNLRKTKPDSAYAIAGSVIRSAAKTKQYDVLGDATNIIGLINDAKDKYKDALKNFTEALSYYQKTNDQKRIAKAYNNLGGTWYSLDNYEKATEYHKKALLIRQAINDPLLSATYNSIGIIYYEQGNYTQALDNYLKAVAVAEKYNDEVIQAKLSTNICVIYWDQKNYTLALQYAQKALSLHTKANNYASMATTYNNIAGIALDQDDFKTAKGNFDKAILYAAKVNYPTAMATAYSNLGEMAFRQGDYHKAIEYSMDALAKRRQIGKKPSIVKSLIKLGEAYAKIKEYDKAETVYLEALDISNKSGLLKERTRIYNELSDLYKNKNDLNKAYSYLQKFQQANDTLFNDANSKTINELQTKYETEKKQKQIEILNHQSAIQHLKLTQSKLQVDNQQLLLEKSKLHIANQNLDLDKKQALLTQKKLEAGRKQQQIMLLNKQNKIQALAIQKRNTTIGLISGSLLMVLLLAGLFYNRYKLKQEARLQAEVIHQQNIASKGIIEAEERERKRIAADLHDGVGQTFSAVRLNLASLLGRIDISKTDDAALADKTMALVDESCKEVRTIAHQMMPNILLKMGLSSAVKDFINKIDADKLKVTLQTSGLNERLDSNTEIVLYRVLQECVNNVIKHAEATRLDIQLDRDEGGISATIEDNGKGFATGNPENFEGIGLKNIITRLTYLKGTVDFSSAPGKGTLVAIYVPLVQV
jgi:two-component system NarL family sensor kinase